MNRRKFIKAVPPLAVFAGTAASYPISDGEGLKPVILPTPEKEGGKSVLASLAERKTTRSISSREIPEQVLSNLLWSAFGVNRNLAAFNKKGRTAPSASNSQEIDLYVVLPAGVYIYEAEKHQLSPVAGGDYRARSGRENAVTAPLNIFYIADTSRYDLGPSQPDHSIGDPEVQKSYYFTDTGFIAQNVYLFAASFGLAAWFHNCDKTNTVREFKLRTTQKVLFAQTIGYPE
jgi:nitroreductase